MEKANNFNYEDICRLCREHYQEIVERKNLSYILQNRKVRYIDPEGRFDYTTFGNFYVTSRNVMMLVMREPFIARYHRPDSMRDSLWSAVPVLFAGVETGGRDSRGREIYTGDVLQVSEPAHCTGTVVYFSDATIACVRLDNHCLFLNEVKRSEIIGNVFFDIDEMSYEYYNSQAFFGINPFFQGPVSEEIRDVLIRKIMEAPSFRNGKPQPKERYSMIYHGSISKIGYKKGDYLVVFCEDRDYDPNDEDTYPTLFVDSDVIPEDCPLVCKEIPIDLYYPDWEKVQKRVDEIMLEAHNNPSTKYILCDLRSQVLDKEQYYRIAELFRKAGEYHIGNFIMPITIAIP